MSRPCVCGHVWDMHVSDGCFQGLDSRIGPRRVLRDRCPCRRYRPRYWWRRWAR